MSLAGSGVSREEMWQYCLPGRRTSVSQDLCVKECDNFRSTVSLARLGSMWGAGEGGVKS